MSIYRQMKIEIRRRVKCITMGDTLMVKNEFRFKINRIY